jgi:Flp pilus assembly protein TadB
MRDPWVETITRPASHLVATCAVFAVLIACVVISVLNPAWTSVFGVMGAAPVVGWYLFMMKRYRQNRARWSAEAEPHE